MALTTRVEIFRGRAVFTPVRVETSDTIKRPGENGRPRKLFRKDAGTWRCPGCGVKLLKSAAECLGCKITGE